MAPDHILRSKSHSVILRIRLRGAASPQKRRTFLSQTPPYEPTHKAPPGSFPCSPGVEGREPGLSKLKDRRSWEKRKSKGRAHIQKMVINILKLYRLRAAVSRPVYPPDGEAQARFESAFKYQPTDHQQQVLLPFPPFSMLLRLGVVSRIVRKEAYSWSCVFFRGFRVRPR